MLLLAAKTILVAIAAFFLLLGSASLIAPDRARRLLLGFAATAARHYTELALRFVAGGAMLLFAAHSIHHVALAAFGWVLIATTAIMGLVPWRVHRRFAEAAVPRALRFLSVVGGVSLVLGVLLLWVIVAADTA